jgi:CubicO group peptidase (beta-lactamase class C family)
MFTGCDGSPLENVASEKYIMIKSDMVFPGSDWEERTPESQGVDTAKLNKAVDYLHARAGGAGASEVVVIRNGYIIWKGSNIDHKHTINSGTKTFTTTVLGLMVQDGKLKMEDFAVKYLPGLDDRYPVYSRITLRHLSTMTSGYDSEKGNITQERPWGDPENYLAPEPPLFEPGTSFKYHDPPVHLLGYILTKVAGEPLHNIFKQRIADHIGLTDWEWKKHGSADGILFNNPSGIYEGGIHITARQMARYGHLYLNRGNWDGKQLLDSSWIDLASTNQVPISLSTKGFDLRGRYGLMWWTNGTGANGKRLWPSAPPRAYTSHGGFRNFCFVIPEWNMVIVRMEKSVSMPDADKTWDKFFKILGKGILPCIARPEVTEEFKVWQPLTLSFKGPYKSELDSDPNPFLDYRLQAVFTDSNGCAYDVPGFFDGDGRGGGTGDVWRVRFTPDKAGMWTYTVSFRQGKGIAIKHDPHVGRTIFFDGMSDTFTISDQDSNSPGFSGKGRLVYDNSFYLKTSGDGKYWIKGGTDSPENFLAYHGFDRTSSGKFGIHTYSNHIAGWDTGDPDWGNGKGKGIIGALNYLSSRGVNSIYVLLMNIGGDGQDTWPYAGRIHRSGSKYNDNRHFDIGKLRQWEIVFGHAQKRGINLNLVLAEGEKMNKLELDSARLGIERKLYFREMVARFGHHNALQWMLCEEYDHSEFPLDPEKVRSWSQYIRDIDPYDHPISVHNMAEDAWDPFFGDVRFDLTSYQYAGKALNGKAYSDKVKSLRSKSLSSGRKIPISIDETVTTSRSDDEKHLVVDKGTWKQHICGQSYIRKNVIYPIYFSGGHVELILQDLLQTDDFQQYEKVWQYMYYARKFMEDNLPFWEMEPMDYLLTGGSEGGQVFAKKEEIYALYLPEVSLSGRLDLRGVPGTFKKRWYNPREGRFEGAATSINGDGIIAPGLPPSEPSQDWVVLLKR